MKRYEFDFIQFLLCASEFHCEVDNCVLTILAHPCSDCHILLALVMDPLPYYRLPKCHTHTHTL